MRKMTLLACLAIAAFYFSNNNAAAVEPSSTDTRTGIASFVNHKGNLTVTRENFDEHVRRLHNETGAADLGLDYNAFRLGLVGYYRLEKEGSLNDTGLLTIIDFSRPSTEKRFYTIDLKNREVKYHTFVAHGRNTGENMATKFSNIPHSNQSSLGFYVTGETYVGSKGYSLRLDGKERTFNDKIRSRAVVIHAADYATESWIKRYGRLGRSQGCPALPPELSREVINSIKDRTAIFTYYPDENYLSASQYLKVEELFRVLDENPIKVAAEERLTTL